MNGMKNPILDSVLQEIKTPIPVLKIIPDFNFVRVDLIHD